MDACIVYGANDDFQLDPLTYVGTTILVAELTWMLAKAVLRPNMNSHNHEKTLKVLCGWL